MLAHEWVAYTREPDYSLNVALPLSSVQVVKRHIGVGTAVVKVPFSPERLNGLQPPCGMTLFRDGVQEFSGMVVALNPVFDPESGRDVITVNLVGDEQHLDDRIVFPDRFRAADDQTTLDYWTFTGVASTAMQALVSQQAGPDCYQDRQVPGLALGADPGVGVSRDWSALFDNVMDQLRLMSVASGANLGIRMSTSPGTLLVDVVAPRDLSSSVVFSTDLSNLAGVDYRISAPTLTHALAAGQGDLHLRLRKLAVTTDPLTLQWKRQIWSYIDRRDTADVSELLQACLDALADGGPTVSLAVTLLDSDSATYRRDWDLGDKVTVYVGQSGQSKVPVTDLVREIAIDVDENGRERIRPAIGSFDAKAVIPTPTQQKLADVGTALASLIARK